MREQDTGDQTVLLGTGKKKSDSPTSTQKKKKNLDCQGEKRGGGGLLEKGWSGQARSVIEDGTEGVDSTNPKERNSLTERRFTTWSKKKR